MLRLYRWPLLLLLLRLRPLPLLRLRPLLLLLLCLSLLLSLMKGTPLCAGALLVRATELSRSGCERAMDLL